MNADPRPYEDEIATASIRFSAAILPFDKNVGRRARRVSASSDVIGEILLFTGVRYERQGIGELRREDSAPAARARTPS